MKDAYGRKLTPHIDKADSDEEHAFFEGIEYKPYEYVSVTRKRESGTTQYDESACEELTNNEVKRLIYSGLSVTHEIEGGVGCIFLCHSIPIRAHIYISYNIINLLAILTFNEYLFLMGGCKFIP